MKKTTQQPTLQHSKRFLNTISLSLLGGILLIFIDKWLENNENKEIPSYKNSFLIGLFQCLAMIPGVSRSAATIIGGMTQGLNRKSAAEFSFFLAVPTMAGASALKSQAIPSDNPDAVVAATPVMRIAR